MRTSIAVALLAVALVTSCSHGDQGMSHADWAKGVLAAYDKDLKPLTEPGQQTGGYFGEQEQHAYEAFTNDIPVDVRKGSADHDVLEELLTNSVLLSAGYKHLATFHCGLQPYTPSPCRAAMADPEWQLGIDIGKHVQALVETLRSAT